MKFRSIYRPLILAAFLIAVADTSCTAHTNKPEATIPAKVLRIVDGDTLEIMAIPWPMWSHLELIRLRGIDAPETHRPSCEAEKKLGEEARMLLSLEIGEMSFVYLRDFGMDEFGRMLARVILPDGRDLGQILIDAGLAQPYDG